MTGLMEDQNLESQIEKQIGCMSGFIHILDRQHILAGQCIHSAKCLHPSIGAAVSSDSVKSVNSVKSNVIREIEKPKLVETVVSSPGSEHGDGFQPSPVANLKFFSKSTPRPFPIFEVKNSWKFCKEMPRLSLDSRATVDSKGSLCPREIRPDSHDGSFENQGRSPSVIAKLMGLEQLPSSVSSSSTEVVTKPELRRSTSESRVSTNLSHSGFIDGKSFQTKQPNQSHKQSSATKSITQKNVNNNFEMKYSSRSQKGMSSPLHRCHVTPHRRSFFDSAEFFLETKHTTVLISGKNYEESKDLEVLKNILDALQLKGLLHSLNRDRHRNFVYDDSNVVIKNRQHSCSSNRRCSNDISPKTDRGVFDRSGRSPVRARNSAFRSKTELNSKNRNANDKTKPLRVETEKRFRESSESRRNSRVNSPKLTPKRSGPEHGSVVASRSPKRRPSKKSCLTQKVSRTVVVEDESSSVSESSGSTTSQFDLERSKMEEYREGKSLLARCDKLLAEMNSIAESHTSSNSILPSPISVLDSAFDKDESSSPSPVKKRTIDFKGHTDNLDDDLWSSIISPETPTKDEEFISNDSDFKYISQILQASKHLPIDSNAFLFLEKQHYLKENDPSNGPNLQRKLVFDIVTEILNRNKDLPPWNTTSLTKSRNSVKNICSEFQKIREPETVITAENLLDLICSVLKNDLARDNKWDDHPVEKSEAVLYIEQLIFKDLVSETIRDLADFAGKPTFLAPRRRLVF